MKDMNGIELRENCRVLYVTSCASDNDGLEEGDSFVSHQYVHEGTLLEIERESFLIRLDEGRLIRCSWTAVETKNLLCIPDNFIEFIT